MISCPAKTSNEPGTKPTLVLGLASFLLLGCTGCSSVSNQRLADCQKLAQSVQADNSRLKDVALKLRTENQDLTQRSIDDAKKIKTLADNNERLSRSVSAYQDERERMARQLDNITRQARVVGFDPDDGVRRAENDEDTPRSALRTDP